MKKANRLVRLFNAAAPGADTAIVGGFVPAHDASALRITVALTTGSVLNLTATDGTTTHKWGLNASSALNAADLYTFQVAAPKHSLAGNALTYDLEVETDSVIELLVVDELVHEAGIV